MAVGKYTLEQEKRKLLEQQAEQQRIAAETGKAVGIGAGVGAATGAGTAAATAWGLNVWVGPGTIAYGVAIGIGAIIGAISGSAIGAAVAPGSFADVITGGETQSIEQQLDILARAGEMADRLRRVGNKTYIKVSGLRSIREPRQIRDPRVTRDIRLSRDVRGIRYERDTRTERWVPVKQTSEETQETQKQIQSAFADYSSPSQINDPLDILSRTLNQPFAKDSITGDWGPANFLKFLTGVWVVDATHAFIDSAIWDLDGEGNSYFQNVIYRPIEQAVKGEISVGTMFAALGINMLGSVGQTLDVLANPMKGLLKNGFKGMGAAWGIGTGGERINYDFNTGNIVSDIILEIAWDPMNWITFGGKAIAGGAAKGVKTGIQTGVKTAATGSAKEILQEAFEKGSKIVAKEGTELSADVIVDVASKRITKDAGKLISKQMGEVAEGIINSAPKQLATEILKQSGKEITEETIEQTIKTLSDSDIVKHASKLLADQLSDKTTMRVINTLIDQGFDVVENTKAAIVKYTKQVIKETFSSEMTLQIQKTFGSQLFKSARVMTKIDDVFTRFGMAVGTFGMSEGVRYALRSAPIRGFGKILKKIPGQVKAGIIGAGVGAAAGAIVGSQIGEGGAGWGALVGGAVGAVGATSILTLANGATMRAILRGVPQDSAVYDMLKVGKIPINQYAELSKQYGELFNYYSRILDNKLIKSNPKVKIKVDWFTQNTVEGLNPIQLLTLKQINMDTQIFRELLNSNKLSGEVSSAWSEYIANTHNMSVAQYRTSIKKIGVIEGGQFVDPIAKQEIWTRQLHELAIHEQIIDPKNAGRITQKNLKAKQTRAIKKTLEAFREAVEGRVAPIIAARKTIIANNNLVYYKVVQSDIAILDELVETFTKDQKISKELTDWLEESVNKNDTFRGLYKQTQDIQKLQSIINVIRNNEVLRKVGYDDVELNNILIRSFWNLKNAPYGASTDQLVEMWISNADSYIRSARLPEAKGLASVSEFRDEMRNIVNYVNDDGFLTQSMRSFDNIQSKDSFLYKINKKYKDNIKTIKELNLKKTLDETELLRKKILIDQNTMLTEWKVRLHKVQELKYNTNLFGLNNFTSTLKSFEELQNISSFSALSDLQKSMGLDYMIESGTDTFILNKFFEFPDGLEVDHLTFESLGELTKNAKVVSDTINDLRPLAKGRLARKELDEMWDLLMESIEESEHPFLQLIRQDLSPKEKYAFLYAISQAIDYRLNNQALQGIFQPYFDAIKTKKIPHLEALLKSPDSLGFKNFRPGLRNQIQTVINQPESFGITSYAARKNIFDAQSNTAIESLTATELRLQKQKTISNSEVMNNFLEITKEHKTTLDKVKTLSNTLGERMDWHMAQPYSGNANDMLHKMRTIPLSLKDSPDALQFFTPNDSAIMEHLWKNGIFTTDELKTINTYKTQLQIKKGNFSIKHIEMLEAKYDAGEISDKVINLLRRYWNKDEIHSEEVLRNIFRRAEAYEATRWNAEKITDRFITNPKLKTHVQGFLGADSELRFKKRLTDKLPYAGRYVGDFSGYSLREEVRTTIENILDNSGLNKTQIQDLTYLLHSREQGSLSAFNKLITSYKTSFTADTATEISELIQKHTDKFTNADALRYLITKNDYLDAVEFAEYVRIMGEFNSRFYMAEIPIEYIPNSYKKAWIQNRLAQWNSQAISAAQGTQIITDAAVEFNGYKSVMEGMQELKNSKIKEASLAYLEQFSQVPGNMLARMQTGADAALFRSILNSLGDDAAFWEVANGWENFINRYYGPQYQAVYLANYAEMAKRGQITINKTFNWNNSAVRRETMLDMLSGGFEAKLEQSSYRAMLKEVGIEGVPDFDVPISQRVSITFRVNEITTAQQTQVNESIRVLNDLQRQLDQAQAAVQQNLGTRQLQLDLGIKKKSFKIKDLDKANRAIYENLQKEANMLREFTTINPQAKTQYESLLNQMHEIEAKYIGSDPIAESIIIEGQNKIKQLENQIQEQITIFEKFKADGIPIKIWYDPRMPGSNTMFYKKMREMQSGIISTLNISDSRIIMPIMHDGVSINLKAPTRPADEFYNRVVQAFDKQSYVDIAQRFNMMPDDFLMDLAHHGGGVILSYDQIQQIPATHKYFNLKNKKPGQLLQNVDHSLFKVIYNDEQKTAMIILNLNRIKYDQGSVYLLYSNINTAKKPIWRETTERVIQRNYDALRDVDEQLWKHTIAVTAVDNPKAYGQLWQRNTWGHNSELLEESFFDMFFNGYSSDQIGALIGKQTAAGNDLVEYWQGWNKEQLKIFEDMGWGTIEDGQFKLTQQYNNHFGGFDVNSIIMGDSKFARRFYPNQPRDMIDSFNRQANFIAAQGKTQIEWINDLYNGYDAHRMVRSLKESGIPDEDILKGLQERHRTHFVGIPTFDPKSISGIRLTEIPMIDKKSLDIATQHGGLIFLRTDAYMYKNYLNRPLKSNKAWNFINKIMYLYKYGWLSMNPGTLMRNWFDTELKTKIELDTDSAFYKHLASNIEEEFNIMLNTIYGNNNTKFGITQQDIAKFFNRPDLKQLNITYLDKNLAYALADFVQNGPMNNMVQEQYGRAMIRSSKIKSPFAGAAIGFDFDTGKVIRETAEEVSKDGWENFVGLLQDKNPLVQINNKIENRNRIALFLESYFGDISTAKQATAGLDIFGFTASQTAREEAFDRIRRIHFDYNNRSPIMKKLELVFPFLGWTLDNMRYWLDIIEKKPWIIHMYFNIYQPIWNLDDYTPEQLEQSTALQQMILSSNIPLLGPGGILSDEEISEGDARTYLFKMNPSFADAFGGISNPIGMLKGRMNSVVTKATELAINGNLPFENWLADDINRNPEAYFEAGKTSPEIFKLIQQYADLIPVAGTIYNRWYTAYKQSTGVSVPLSTAGMITGGLGITSHVQLKATARYGRGGRPTSFQWNPKRSARVNHAKYRSLVGRRVTPTPYTTSRVFAGVNPLPNKDPHKIWKKQMINPQSAVKSAITGLDKIKARKMSAQLYGINVSAFR